MEFSLQVAFIHNYLAKVFLKLCFKVSERRDTLLSEYNTLHVWGGWDRELRQLFKMLGFSLKNFIYVFLERGRKGEPE